MPDYVQRQVSREEARDYLQERLRDGLTLARKVVASLNLDAGRAFTFVPADLGDEDLLKLHAGRLRTEAPQEPNDWYAAKVCDFLAAGPERVCVFESALARPNHPNLSQCVSRIVTYNDDVYSVLCSGEESNKAAARAIGDACSAWISLGFMTACPPGWNRASGRFSAQALDFMAKHVEMIAADVYDHENWLIWEKA